MSAGAAALLFVTGGIVVFLIDLLAPTDAPTRLDEVERGSTTILPEDR